MIITSGMRIHWPTCSHIVTAGILCLVFRTLATLATLKSIDRHDRLGMSCHILTEACLCQQRWGSCGEENILSRIRDRFVEQGGCADLNGGESSLLREADGNQTLCNMLKTYEDAWKQY